jgi:hypothetical protein
MRAVAMCSGGRYILNSEAPTSSGRRRRCRRMHLHPCFAASLRMAKVCRRKRILSVYGYQVGVQMSNCACQLGSSVSHLFP